jgi:hypothetical protein
MWAGHILSRQHPDYKLDCWLDYLLFVCVMKVMSSLSFFHPLLLAHTLQTTNILFYILIITIVHGERNPINVLSQVPAGLIVILNHICQGNSP